MPWLVYKDVPAPEVVHKGVGPGKRPEDVFLFTLSTPQEDRHGDVILPGAWDLQEYQRNPVVMWLHGQDPNHMLPIGKAGRVWVEGGELMAQIQFDAGTDPATGRYLDPFAHEIGRKYAEGTLRAASVGFRPLESRSRTASNGQKGTLFERVELLDVSMVTVGAHPEALVQKGLNGHRAGAVVLSRNSVLDWALDRSIDRLEAHLRQLANSDPGRAIDRAIDHSIDHLASHLRRWAELN